MTSTVAKIRYVKCPKCYKLLIELPDVPVYQCGGCDTLLRAKYSIAAGENGTAGSLGRSCSQGNGSSDSGLSSSEKQMTPCSNEHSPAADQGGDHHGMLPSSSSDAESNCHQRGEFLEIGDDEIREEASNTDQLAFRSSQDGSIRAETDYCLNEESDKCPKPSQPDSFRDKIEESPESVSQDVASEEGLVDKTSPTSSSQAYDGSVSSSDEGSNGCAPDKYLPSTTRSFSHQSVLNSVDTQEKEGDIDSKPKLEENLSMKSSNERHQDWFGSSRDGSSSRYRFRTQERGISLDSADFYSVQNWTESEMDVPSRALSRGSTFYRGSFNREDSSTSAKFKHLGQDRLELLRMVDELSRTAKFKHLGQDRSELLRMVDELRDQVSELYDRREGERRSQIRRDPLFFNQHSGQQRPQRPDPTLFQHQQYQFPGLPYHSCLHCHPGDYGPCRACAYNMYRHPSMVHIHDLELEKLSNKEKRQTPKRHCRPLSGGAPFVICYQCLELLQLPADFLISRKRLQKLQCGACSEVLLFSFHSSARVTPRAPIEVFGSPSGVESSADAAAESFPGDPLSFSEEYGLSSGKSFSTEAEPVSNVSTDTSEKRNGRRSTGSLHWLMGYPSATVLLYQPIDDEGMRVEN